ncbi:unnamed protein product, partial [Mesorhabditis belari]|uniref:C-type lectin n=1 Tax=Mesorhabditis belari TaxID=2138241 RepID=A0AAF3ECD8_9BILA
MARLLLFVGLLVALVAADCPADWLYSRYLNGSCYKVVTQTGGLTYEEAEALCKAANSNSQLASIHSPVEDQFIIDISAMATTTSQYQTLLGGKRVENGWQWSDGTAFDYTNFAADGNTGRQCVQSPTNPATKPAECSLGWYYDRRFNSCYKVVTPNSSILDFNSANEVCQNASAQLASIHSAEENELIVALASDLSLTVSVISYQTLLGARRVDNTWTWTDGTPFDYNNILTDADYNYIPCLQLWATNTTMAQPNRQERGKLYRGNWDALNFDRRAPEFFWEIFCAQCDKAITRDYIIERQVVQVWDDWWHDDCLKCTKCELRLLSQNGKGYENGKSEVNVKLDFTEYPANSKKPTCCECYGKEINPQCAGCTLSLDRFVYKALGKMWHDSCFTCRRCFRPFPEKKFYVLDGKPYDIECYHLENFGKQLEEPTRLSVHDWLKKNAETTIID